MRINLQDSKFRTLQLSGTQLLLPKNKTNKILATTYTNTENFQL